MPQNVSVSSVILSFSAKKCVHHPEQMNVLALNRVVHQTAHFDDSYQNSARRSGRSR